MDRLALENAKLARASARRAAPAAGVTYATVRHASATATLHAAKPRLHATMTRLERAERRSAAAVGDAARTQTKGAAIWLPNGSFRRPVVRYFHDMKCKPKYIALTLNIDTRTLVEFAQASREVARRTGTAPAVEAMMAHMLKARNDADDLADMYCFCVLKHSAERVGERR